RAGACSAAVVTRVGCERRASFLLERDGGQRYLIGGHLRATVIFGTHRLLDDPAFPRIDLVCCPYGLRRLGPGDQARALEMFRSALRPGGHLFLAGSGPGEIEAFVAVSRRCGIYRRFRTDDPASTPLTVCVDTN